MTIFKSLNDSNTFEKRYINSVYYVEMKNLNDSFDLDNFEQYETIQGK